MPGIKRTAMLYYAGKSSKLNFRIIISVLNAFITYKFIQKTYAQNSSKKQTGKPFTHFKINIINRIFQNTSFQNNSDCMHYSDENNIRFETANNSTEISNSNNHATIF